MATVKIDCDHTIYVLASTVDALVQNTSPGGLRVVFDTVLPTVDTENYHVLARGEAITKSSGVPAGNIYVRSNDVGRHNKVAVST